MEVSRILRIVAIAFLASAFHGPGVDCESSLGRHPSTASDTSVDRRLSVAEEPFDPEDSGEGAWSPHGSDSDSEPPALGDSPAKDRSGLKALWTPVRNFYARLYRYSKPWFYTAIALLVALVVCVIAGIVVGCIEGFANDGGRDYNMFCVIPVGVLGLAALYFVTRHFASLKFPPS